MANINYQDPSAAIEQTQLPVTPKTKNEGPNYVTDMANARGADINEFIKTCLDGDDQDPDVYLALAEWHDAIVNRKMAGH